MCNVSPLVKMLMCEGANTFLIKSKSVGSERGLDGIFVLPNTYPLPGPLRKSQLRPFSVICCLDNCLQSLINLKNYKANKKRNDQDCMKKIWSKAAFIMYIAGGGGRGYFWKGQSFSYPLTSCRIFWHPPSWPKEKRRKKFHLWCKTKKLFKDLLPAWWEFACDHFWL